MGSNTGKRADKTSVDVKSQDNPTAKPNQNGPEVDPEMLRVCGRERERILIPEGESAYRKDLLRYTMNCPDCRGTGYHDDIGEVVCEDCGLVISDNPDQNKSFAGTIYADKYSGQGGSNDTSSGNRGTSGHPLMRVPALRSPGPSGDSGAVSN